MKNERLACEWQMVDEGDESLVELAKLNVLMHSNFWARSTPNETEKPIQPNERPKKHLFHLFLTFSSNDAMCADEKCFPRINERPTTVGIVKYWPKHSPKPEKWKRRRKFHCSFDDQKNNGKKAENEKRKNNETKKLIRTNEEANKMRYFTKQEREKNNEKNVQHETASLLRWQRNADTELQLFFALCF